MSESLTPLRKKLIIIALQLAKDDYGVELDFSENSLKAIDDILKSLSKQLKTIPDSEEKRLGIQGIALELAAYIIQVIENQYGEGLWERDSEEFGKETWPYRRGYITIFPVNWCLKSIESDGKEKIWKKYTAFVKAVNRKV